MVIRYDEVLRRYVLVIDGQLIGHYPNSAEAMRALRELNKS